MNPQEDEIIQDLISLRRLLLEQRGGQFLPGVDAVLRLFQNEKVISPATFDQARSIFKTSMGGMGTLGDFVIWNGNQQESSGLNIQLSNLLKRIGNYFSGSLTSVGVARKAVPLCMTASTNFAFGTLLK